MLKAAGSCGPLRLLLVVLCVLRGFRVVSGATDPQDATGLQSLMSQWQNFPPNWGQSNDPCGQPWDGVNCSSSRVTTLKLSTMGIKGTLSSDIALLSELQTLDLSYNNELGGTLPPNIGNLKNLKTLILAGCNFTGPIPETLGNPPLLSYIALNSNKFTGTIPASLGKLSNINWLDLAENRLTGTIPVSSSTNPGLDLLFSAKHFHFNKNQLTGSIPRQIFNSKMTLIHILFDGNQLTGEIPETVGLVSTLEVLRLDKNQLNGSIPSSIRNLTLVNELNLANNQLQGVIPDLTGMNKLNYLDLSNNSFDVSDFPDWVTNLRNLTTIVFESARLGGNLPANLLNIPQLQQVILKNNSLNGTLDLTDATSNQLQLIDLQNNNISFITQGSSTRFTLILYGNPICDSPAPNTRYCLLQQQMGPAYSTSLASCASNSCPAGQSVAPYNCDCAYPYTGLMVFRAPSFSDLTNKSRFQQLESSLWTTLGLAPNSVSLQNLMFNSDGYLQLQLSLFQYGSTFFTRPEILRFGFYLSNQTYKPPADFGPYFFIGSPYPFEGTSAGKKSSLSTGAVAGIALGCSVLLIALIVVGVYAFRQKKRAERAIEITHPFASWVPSGTDAGGAPQLKGARFFTFDEVKKCTSSFSEAKEIGAGGYGKVYKGTLPSGQTVAIKRAEQGSLQGALEFKTEIELLSRVHHKNLVGLVGFCFEQGEQMLVYEFVSNGTLRENLVGKVGIQLDWKRRLRIAVGSARGLAYLHDLADPPIIHRDIKSSNILLDENLTAKVADFGLSKLVADSEKGHISTQVKGTLGYLDPEYYMTQQLTDRSDVYSFGVVMLELITSKLPIEKGKYIVREIRTAIDRNDEEYYGLREIIDPVIRNSQLVGFKRFLELALRCVQESATERPRMNEVVKELETILQDEGSNPASTFSSATDFGNGDGGHRHPYVDQLPSGTPSSDPFDNSMGYAFLTNIEPK